MKKLIFFHRFIHWRSAALGLIIFGSLNTPGFAGDDSRVKAVNDFLWQRTHANDVIEYSLMTPALKDHYRYDRKVKIRREAGRLLTFRFDEKSLASKDGGKKFEVAVVGTWVNLNDHLIGEVDEQDTFVETPRGWRADKIKFGHERPTEKAIVDGFGAPKEYRDALRVLKVVLRAWVDRDAETARKGVSPAFERTFRSHDEVLQLFIGLSNPHHAAYAIRRIANTDRNVCEFDVDFYEMVTGDTGLSSSRVRIEVKKYDSGWFIDSWTPLKTSGPTP
jgi:hypothetical protein